MEQMSHGTMSGKCLRMKGVALRIFRLTLQEIIKRELLEEMESIYGNALPAASQTGDHRDEMEQEAAEVPEPDMSDAMMTMALAMGDWVPE